MSLRKSAVLGVLLFACSEPVFLDGNQTELAESAPPALEADVRTVAFPNYDDSPRAPDADDPAIWVNPKRASESLIIGTLKDAGLAVFALDGSLLQVIAPPSRPALSEADPQIPGHLPEASTGACADSDSGETFGRFNNVDVFTDFVVRDGRKQRRMDIAVVTDRGCDHLRIYEIDPTRAGGPLFDITSDDAPRVFPQRYVQPWDVSERAFVEENPLDDQSTAYGITTTRVFGRAHAFVTQRSRTAVAQVELVAEADGSVSYRVVRELRFPARFSLRAGHEALTWTPCREDAVDDPQLEGLVVDDLHGVLYAAQEVVGIYKIPLPSLRSRVEYVSARNLFEPVTSFGAPYWAVPDEDEFACEGESPGELPEGSVVQPGSERYRGARLTADAEGLAIFEGRRGEGYLVASSQGDDTFHVYARRGGVTRAHANRFLGSFTVAGAGETDGHEVTAQALGRAFPHGLFVMQNGKASGPANTEPVNGYPYDHATQFLLIDWRELLAGVLDD